jgi:competence protein ComEC
MGIGVYCLEVGQGQCIALIGPSPEGSQAALIDVGIDGERLARWLRTVGVRRIPLVVLTHNHEDHIKGLASLIRAFPRLVGDVRFVVEQASGEIPFWISLQKWRAAGKIGSANIIYPPDTSQPSNGLELLDPGLAGFQLFCIYPTVFEAGAVAHDAPLVGTHPGRGANAASAILRLARLSEPGRTIALFGGDLTFRGWRRLGEKGHDLSAEVLVVPHHGSSHGADHTFGPEHLARAVRPRFALFSVGTDNSFGHPRGEVVRAFRDAHSTILCTQITGRCAESPERLTDGAVLVRTGTEPNLAMQGVACAGTIVVRVPDAGPVDVLRLTDHQAAVDRLPRDSGRPMCRPRE